MIRKDRQTRLIASRVLWTALILFAAYWLAALALPPQPLLAGARAVQIAVAAIVLVAYAPAALSSLRARRPDRVQQLTMGICLTWGAIIVGGLWSILWSAAGEPRWMLERPIAGFPIWCSILGATLFVTAPGSLDGVIPRRNWLLLGSAFGAGVGATLLILATAPDLTQIAAALAKIFG